MFENVDGRTNDGVIGILIAHLGAFGSGELKIIADRYILFFAISYHKAQNEKLKALGDFYSLHTQNQGFLFIAPMNPLGASMTGKSTVTVA